MAIILAAPSRGPILICGNEYVGLDANSRDKIRAQGVPYCVITPAIYDRAVKVYSSGTDEEIEDRLNELKMLITAVLEVETREEQRDLADG